LSDEVADFIRRKARVTVHFQAISERFTPHDTVFNISSSDDLNDTTLGAACALHTASPSAVPAATRKKKEKLDGITEDEEEEAEEDGRNGSPVPSPEPHITQSKESTPTIQIEDTSQSKKSDTESEKALEPLPDGPPKVVEYTVERTPKPEITEKVETPTSAAVSPSSIISKEHDPLYDPDLEHRFSSQTARPSISDLYGFDPFKPKVKLGPRPRPSLDTNRPHTAGNQERPVSTLPAGLKIGPRKTNLLQRPKSRDSSIVPRIAVPPPPPIPNVPDISVTPMRMASSAASVKSLPATVHRTPPSPGISHEKQRLMKALELRKKQLKAQKEKEEAEKKAPAIASQDSVATPTVVVQPGTPDTPAFKTKPEPESVTEKTNGAEQDLIKPPKEVSDQVDGPCADKRETEATDVDDHVLTNSASSPTSVQDSTASQSTRPSSISEHDDDVKSAQVEKIDSPAVPELKSTSNELDEPNEPVHELPLVEESTGSSPTIIPERVSPPPSELTASPIDPVPATASIPKQDATEDSKENLKGVEPEDTASAKKKARRESAMLWSNSSSPRESKSPRHSGQGTLLKERRKPVMDLHLDISTETSDDYDSDDALYEELQSATVEEAKPISVSKSPITPIFPRRGSAASNATLFRRTPSGNVLELTRSFSGSQQLNTPPRESNEPLLARKTNVSSGISQRIQALAKKSNRDSVASIGPVNPGEGSSPSGARLNVTRSRNSSMTQNMKRFSQMSISNSPSPDGNALQGSESPLQVHRTPMSTVYNVDERPGSVSVTARIIRDDRAKRPDLTMPTDISPLELHESPITIDHHRATSVSTSRPSLHQRSETSTSVATSPVARESSQHSISRTSSESSWRPFGRRKSEAAKSPPINLKSPSMVSMDMEEDKKDDKKQSRTSRLFKRMSSSISNASRKSIMASISPVKDDADIAKDLASISEPPPAVQVGDLNVQFPDSLVSRTVSCCRTSHLTDSSSGSDVGSKLTAKVILCCRYQKQAIISVALQNVTI
jgi:hypothetical protein